MIGHLPIQCVPGALTPGVKQQGMVKLTTHFQLVGAELKKKWIYTSTPHKSSWSSA
jgi:hypothetical protein